MLKFSILILKFIRTCSAWQGQELLIQKITPISINKILDINNLLLLYMYVKPLTKCYCVYVFFNIISINMMCTI